MEYPIQQLARAAGTTSRTLRHYDSLGLVRPSRIGGNGYRYYDDRSLVRLQRVLLLRELGLSLDAIGTVLAAQDAGAQAHERPSDTEARVLAQHRELLSNERRRIEAQIASVDRTIAALQGGSASSELSGSSGFSGSSEPSFGRGGERTPEHSASSEDLVASEATGNGHTPRTVQTTHTVHTPRTVHTHQEGESLMAQNIFDGFDHTTHKQEVEERWGAEAYVKSDRWWRDLGKPGQRDWQQLVAKLSSDWAAAAVAGEDPRSAVAQDLAQRHVEWLGSVPGTPAWRVTQGVASREAGQEDSAPGAIEVAHLREYLLGLGEMYVADERFAANYGGAQGAIFVRDALQQYVATCLN